MNDDPRKTPDKGMYLSKAPLPREEVIKLLMGLQQKSDAAMAKESHHDAERKGWKAEKERELERVSDLIRCIDKDLRVWALLDGTFTSYPHPDAELSGRRSHAPACALVRLALAPKPKPQGFRGGGSRFATAPPKKPRKPHALPEKAGDAKGGPPAKPNPKGPRKPRKRT